jgi:hypothetical protein
MACAAGRPRRTSTDRNALTGCRTCGIEHLSGDGIDSLRGL